MEAAPVPAHRFRETPTDVVGDPGGQVGPLRLETEMASTDLGGIERHGSAGGDAYSPISGREAMPVNFVSFYGFRVAGAWPAALGVMHLRAFDPVAIRCEWDAPPGIGGAVHDLVRGDLSSLSRKAGGVGLGPLTCIEDDSPDESSRSEPDAGTPALGAAFFCLVRYLQGLSLQVSPRSDLAHRPGRQAQGSMAYSMVTTTRATLSIVVLS